MERVQARLFMCYVATHPEKLDEQRAEQWRKVTRLTPQQVDCPCP